MREHGYVEGHNFDIVYRFAEGSMRTFTARLRIRCARQRCLAERGKHSSIVRMMPGGPPLASRIGSPGAIALGLAMLKRAKRASHIDPPASCYAIMRMTRPYRGENPALAKDVHGELDLALGIGKPRLVAVARRNAHSIISSAGRTMLPSPLRATAIALKQIESSEAASFGCNFGGMCYF
jgi:hypothetical protein